MKKAIFAVMALVLATLMASCDKEEQSEIKLSVNEITDTTAVIHCEFIPVKSIVYRLQCDSAYSKYVTESADVRLKNLSPGTKYTIVATSHTVDETTHTVNKNVVSTDVVSFMTTGAPDNYKVLIVDPDFNFDLIQGYTGGNIVVESVTDSTALLSVQAELYTSLTVTDPITDKSATSTTFYPSQTFIVKNLNPETYYVFGFTGLTTSNFCTTTHNDSTYQYDASRIPIIKKQ